MKLRANKRTAATLTMAVDALRALLPFFTGKKTYPIGIAQGNIHVQGYVESVITVTEKVVSVKWRNTQPTNSKMISLTVRRIN